MSDSVSICPHCGLPLSALQIGALVSALGVRTRKLLAQHPIPYPHLMSPRTLVRLPKD
jgi:prepilin signal peptidase PulO-like enzyme (type II secretory pathway)